MSPGVPGRIRNRNLRALVKQNERANRAVDCRIRILGRADQFHGCDEVQCVHHLSRVLSRSLRDTRFYIETQGSSPVDLLGLRTVSGQPVVIVSVKSEDRVASRTPNSGQRTSTTVVSPGSSHSITVHVTVNGESGTIAAWLDGHRSPSSRWSATRENRCIQILIGESQTGLMFTVDFDDVEADTNPIS